MKIVVSVTFIIVFLSQVYCQVESTEKRIYNVELSVSASRAAVFMTPTFAVFRKFHKWDIAPEFSVRYIGLARQSILGCYFSYKFFPYKRQKKVDPYLVYNMTFYAWNWGEVLLSYCSNGDCEYPDYMFHNSHLFGIGYEARLGNRFYFFNDLSAGVFLEWRTFKNNKAATFNEDVGRPVDGMIRLGFGYKFNKNNVR